MLFVFTPVTQTYVDGEFYNWPQAPSKIEPTLGALAEGPMGSHCAGRISQGGAQVGNQPCRSWASPD